MKLLVVDANILIRAVLGTRTFRLIDDHLALVEFVVPDTVVREAGERLPAIMLRRRGGGEAAGVALHELMRYFTIAPASTYWSLEAAARRRIGHRDQNDWPVLALALSAGCPIWTEDKDFFGCGVATWNTRNIEIYTETA